MTFYAFALSSFVLLLMPGPTNALLSVAGAVGRHSKMFSLLLTQALSYAVSLSVLSYLALPFVIDNVLIMKSLRVLASLILFSVAFRLWRMRSTLRGHTQAISWPVMLIATLFNPKVIIFTFGIFPEYSVGMFLILGVSTLSFITGGAWFILGAWLGPNFGQSTSRLGAGLLTLCGFAIIIATFF